MTSTRSATGTSPSTAPAPPPAVPARRASARLSGISVNPGDIILADPDGAICIPRKDAAVILEDTKKFQAADEKKVAAAKDGTINRAWVEKSLEEKSCEIIDGVYVPCAVVLKSDMLYKIEDAILLVLFAARV